MAGASVTDTHVMLVSPMENLRYILNDWDFVGVADIVDDEYDCMLAPLLTRLAAGAGRAEISEYLWHELDEHFHLTPIPEEVDRMANHLVAWWAAVS